MSSETITRTDLTNILNEVLPSTSVDYIVEQGTSGNWTYRKWNSGLAELWYYDLTKSSQTFSAWGSLYYADWATGLTFPFAFTSTPIVYITPYDSQAYVIGNWGNSTTAVGTIRFGHNSTTAVALHAHLYVVGRWK